MATRGPKSVANNAANGDVKSELPVRTDPTSGETYRQLLPNGQPDTPSNRARYLADTPGSLLVKAPDGSGYVVVPPDRSREIDARLDSEEGTGALRTAGAMAPAVIGGIMGGPVGAAGGALLGQYMDSQGHGGAHGEGSAQSEGYNPYQGPGALPRPATVASPSGAQATGPSDDTALRDKLLGEREKAGGYVPPTIVANPADRTAGDQIRAQQLQHIQDLRDQAAGRGPSQAGALLNQQLLDTNQNAIGIGASGRGVDAGGGRRMALRSMSENARRNGLDAAVVRQKEMLDANAQLGTQLDTTRTADNTLSTSDADRAARASEAAANAGNTAHATNVQERAGILTGALSAQQTQSQSIARRDAAENQRKQLEFAYAQLANATSQQDKDRWTKVISGLIAAGATVAGAYYGSGGGSGGGSTGGTSSGMGATGDLAD